MGFGRVGFNSHGVFVLSNHVKRYFGIKHAAQFWDLPMGSIVVPFWDYLIGFEI